MRRAPLAISFAVVALAGCSSEKPCDQKLDCGDDEYCDYSYSRCAEHGSFVRLSPGVCKARPISAGPCMSNEGCDPYSQACSYFACLEIGNGNIEPNCPSSCFIDTPPFEGTGMPACICSACPDGSRGSLVHSAE